MNFDQTGGQGVNHHGRSITFLRFGHFAMGRRIRWSRRAARGETRPIPSGRRDLVWKIIAAGSTPGHARGLLRAWAGWARLSELLRPTADVPESRHQLLRVRVERYRRAPVTLPGALQVGRGALVGELHCNNQALLRLTLRRRNAFAACREDMRALAKWLEADPAGRSVFALHASTILVKAANRFGFTAVDAPITIRRRLERMFFTGLLLLYSPEGLRRLRYGTTPRVYPRDVWISRQELIRLHSGRNDRRAARNITLDQRDGTARVARPNSSAS